MTRESSLFTMTFAKTEIAEKVSGLKRYAQAVRYRSAKTARDIDIPRHSHEVVHIKCAGKYFLDKCERFRNTPARCYNCGEAHPVNYRRCAVAKQLQKSSKNTSLEPSQRRKHPVR